ncbi:MAG TPA: ParB N-terminal domain-containing protein [Candidatus Bilamarchaeaceae archaeon]|nr:ParB N-terminal domain-containing protein [Candidatus Bilamarchaeaceae archaeon]
MVVGLVDNEEEEKLFHKLLEYYQLLYPDIGFKTEQKKLDKKELGNLGYTYAGEESEATAKEKMQMISEAIGHGYNTPIIILQKKKKSILLDGHRRVRVALEQGLSWKAYLMIPNKEIEFGIEKMILGKVKDVVKKKKK